MKKLLQAFQNIVDQTNIRGGLTVTGILIGEYGVFTNFCCFLCLCDSRSKFERYIKRGWVTGKI
jgi:hypothetical protein